ncbi:MAG: hypothetical protein WD845_16875 [Pirellulales bacterium]
MLSFSITIHARPDCAQPGPHIELTGGTFGTLLVPQSALAGAAFDCDFETALDRLGQLARMHCEPDGSFVWTAPNGEPAWQLDGNLYDRGQRLSHVDVQGSCPSERFDQLLAALGWPRTPLVFQLRREAVVLDESELRRIAAAKTSCE